VNPFKGDRTHIADSVYL